MEESQVRLKRFLILVIIALIVLLIVIWRSKNYTAISYGEKVELKDGIEFTITSNQVVKELLPTNYIAGYSYYRLFGNEKSILDIKLEVKNTSKKSVKLSDVFQKVDIVANERHYAATIAVEDEWGRDFTEIVGQEIKADQKLVCHLCLGIDDSALKDAKQVSAKIKTFKGKYEYLMNVKSLDEYSPNEKSTININYQGQKVDIDQLITVEGICNFKVLDSSFKNVVEPTIRGRAYRHFTAGNGNAYLDVKLSVENLKDSEELLEEMLGYCIFIDDTNQYNLMKVVEIDGGANLTSQTNIYKIGANQELTYHLIVEVPMEVVNNTNELYLNMYMNGENYIYQIR